MKYSGADVFAGLVVAHTGARKYEYEWFVPTFAPMRVTGPFTAARVREIIVEHVGKKYDVLPEHELASLADLLNVIDNTYQVSEEANANQKQRAEVNYATWVLACFHEARKQAFEQPGVDQQIVENERRLCRQFDAYARMLDATPFALDMDVGLTTPPLEGWHDFDFWIGRGFQLAMEKAGVELGILTNKGPVARFTRAVLREMITEEVPSVPAVGQHLKTLNKKAGKT
jgi:hypothetical protein